MKKNAPLYMRTHTGQQLVCMHTHAFTAHTPHTSESSKSETLSFSVSHNSPRQCIIKVHPPPPLTSTLPPLSLLLSTCYPPTLPVTQQLRPANPFWKETTEQKITSPPLSHTPSLPFVFSSGLQLTPLLHHRHCHCHHWVLALSLRLPPDLFCTSALWLSLLFG